MLLKINRNEFKIQLKSIEYCAYTHVFGITLNSFCIILLRQSASKNLKQLPCDVVLNFVEYVAYMLLVLEDF
jgi:hypothetical protein